MGVDEHGSHREGKDDSDEFEIRTGHLCGRCSTLTTCVMWENHESDHPDGGEVSLFSYYCLVCLRLALGSLERYLRAR
jgi:hypothetical protein